MRTKKMLILASVGLILSLYWVASGGLSDSVEVIETGHVGEFANQNMFGDKDVLESPHWVVRVDC